MRLTWEPELNTFVLRVGVGQSARLNRTQVLVLIAQASDALAASGAASLGRVADHVIDEHAPPPKREPTRRRRK